MATVFVCCFLLHAVRLTDGAPTAAAVVNNNNNNTNETYVVQNNVSFETNPNEVSRNQTLTFRNWWNNVTENYDKRIRPFFGVEPLKVKLGLTLLAVSSISEATMDWTLEMYFHEYWQDTRLKFDPLYFNNKSLLTLPQEAVDRLWTPDTSFINALSCQVPQPGSVSHLALLRVNENGEMFSARRQFYNLTSKTT